MSEGTNGSRGAEVAARFRSEVDACPDCRLCSPSRSARSGRRASTEELSIQSVHCGNQCHSGEGPSFVENRWWKEVKAAASAKGCARMMHYPGCNDSVPDYSRGMSPSMRYRRFSRRNIARRMRSPSSTRSRHRRMKSASADGGACPDWSEGSTEFDLGVMMSPAVRGPDIRRRPVEMRNSGPSTQSRLTANAVSSVTLLPSIRDPAPYTH